MVAALTCLIFILLHSVGFAAQNTGDITVGQSLQATLSGSSWVSPSGDFAFGFHQYNNQADLFLLAIWYVKFPNTIVWYANGGNPVPQGSIIKITANEGLVLSDPQGSHLWDTSDELNSGSTISHGFMNDSGNFALKGGYNNDVVWESFQYPTDTLLPTQILERNFVVFSRLSQTNFTKGRFQLRLIQDGNLVLNTRDLASNFSYGAYYVSGTNAPANNTGQKLLYNESGHTYILREDGSMYDILPPEKTRPPQEFYQRATLNFDGVLIWYRVPRASTGETWSTVYGLPENICMIEVSPGPNLGSGICGYNSICSLGDGQRPRCDCPKNYTLLDPNDTYGSCKPDFEVDDCEGYAEDTMAREYKLLPLPNTDWPFNDYARLNPSSEEECKTSCLNDCFCAAAIFQDTRDPSYTGCWKKKAPLSNGRYGNKVSGIAWLKVATVNYSKGSSNSKVKSKLNTLILLLFGGSIFVNFIFISAFGLGIFLILRRMPIKTFHGSGSKTLKEYSNVHCFRFQELKEATDEFKEELGRGAFGIVYKGVIRIGGLSISVAVKKLDRLGKDADKEFKTEVDVIGQTHHKNLVYLVGFCEEEDQRLLVYEYMGKGSLADYLFDDVRPSWTARVQISMEIARGMLYLHEECRTQIIHCDIKPQNILLDDSGSAHIGDFGLAKLLVLNHSQTHTAIRGTKGYVAPEWFRNKPVSVKVDVYSFGVLLLEIICCEKCISTEVTEEGGSAILTDRAFDCYQSSRLDALVNDDMEALNDSLRLHRFIMVALWCIQEDPALRPTMRVVTQMLEGLADVPNPPCPASFSVIYQY